MLLSQMLLRPNIVPSSSKTKILRYASSYTQFINGDWTSAAADVIEVENPSTHEILAHVPKGTPGDAELALSAAKEAQVSWEAKAACERGQVLKNLANLMAEK